MMRYIVAPVCVALSLLSCSALAQSEPYEPKPQLNQTYHAPARAFDLNLTSSVFRGATTVTESCTIAGVSTDITDSESRFFRVDAINTVNNPMLELTPDAADIEFYEKALMYYNTQLYKESHLLDKKNAKTVLGDGYYAVLQLEGQIQPHYLGQYYLKRGQYLYVIQHLQKVYRPETLKQHLMVLASALRLPGAFKGEDSGSLPILLDLKTATPQEIQQWKKQADCSE